MCALILWRSGLGLLMGKFHPFLTELSAHNTWYFSFRTIACVNLNGFSPNLICALILWRSALGLLFDKFCQFLTELSARDMIMAGYYRFTFYSLHASQIIIHKLYIVGISASMSCESYSPLMTPTLQQPSNNWNRCTVAIG